MPICWMQTSGKRNAYTSSGMHGSSYSSRKDMAEAADPFSEFLHQGLTITQAGPKDRRDDVLRSFFNQAEYDERIRRWKALVSWLRPVISVNDEN